MPPRRSRTGTIRRCACWWSKTKSSSPRRSPTACSAEGFDVDVAHDGTDGLWRAREGSYDAIVLDVLLPGMNGYRVCRTLRDEGVWTPILILTAKDGEYDEAEALDTGADDFLSKPFSFVVLLARLRALHPPRRAAPPDRAHVGTLELDPGARRCRRAASTDIRLTAREFALLEYLVRKDGNVASKAEILDHVWGIDFAGDPNVVEVYVGYLRKKIDAPFGVEIDRDRARRGLPARRRPMTLTVMAEPRSPPSDGAPAPSWPQTVRVRLTVVATLAFAIAISAAAFGLVRLVHNNLIDQHPGRRTSSSSTSSQAAVQTRSTVATAARPSRPVLRVRSGVDGPVLLLPAGVRNATATRPRSARSAPPRATSRSSRSSRSPRSTAPSTR